MCGIPADRAEGRRACVPPVRNAVFRPPAFPARARRPLRSRAMCGTPSEALRRRTAGSARGPGGETRTQRRSLAGPTGVYHPVGLPAPGSARVGARSRGAGSFSRTPFEDIFRNGLRLVGKEIEARSSRRAPWLPRPSGGSCPVSHAASRANGPGAAPYGSRPPPVVRNHGIAGERDCSFPRASAVVNRPSTVPPAALRRSTPAAVSRSRVARSGRRRRRPGCDPAPISIAALGSPLPCFGGYRTSNRFRTCRAS